MQQSNLDDLTNMINIRTRMSLDDRQKAIRWLARQNDIVLVETLKLQKRHFHRLKPQEEGIDLTILTAIALFLGIKDYITQASPKNRKNRSGDFGFLKKVSAARAQQFRKPRTKAKHERLLNLQNVVFELADKGFSSRKISEYLLHYHRFEVSHTTIQSFIKTLNKEGQ